MIPASRQIVLATLAAATFCASALAFAAESGLTVSNAYVRLPPPGTPTTGAFMLIKNDTNSARRLIKADSPVAKYVELHNHVNDNGVMKMRQVSEIAIQSKSETALKPGSYHVMLIDLKQPLKEGETIAITLRFDDGSSQRVNAPVRMPQTTMPPNKAVNEH